MVKEWQSDRLSITQFVSNDPSTEEFDSDRPINNLISFLTMDNSLLFEVILSTDWKFHIAKELLLKSRNNLCILHLCSLFKTSEVYDF